MLSSLESTAVEAQILNLLVQHNKFSTVKDNNGALKTETFE